jgi:hypothetical protein
MANNDKSVTGAKRSPVLDDFFEEVKQGFLSATVKLGKFTFVLELGDEDADVWADQYIRPSTPMAFVSARRAPRLATAIKAIGKGDAAPVGLNELFSYPDSLTPEQKKALDENPVQRQYWLWGQLMAYVTQLPAPVVEKLYSEYDKLVSRRETALKGALESPNS